MQGLGNDYIYVDTDLYPIENLEEFAREFSPRRFGIGGDGLVTISLDSSGIYRMRIFNADGSEALMCGNAIRCVGKFLYERGYVSQEMIDIRTNSGVKHLKLHVSDNRVGEVTVDMNPPVYIHPEEEITMNDGVVLKGIPVSVGNPHWVSLQERELKEFPLEEYGPQVELDPRFEDRTNFEVVRILDRGHVEMRVWERGSGITWACGTGACAVAVALIHAGKVDNEVEVSMLGGTLSIRWSGKMEDPILMRGDAEFVYDGELFIPKA